ncbi:hypothetical protein D9M71_241570 [compost metagenome]
MPAAVFQCTGLVHGSVHACGQAVDALARAVHQLQAFLAGLIRGACGLGRLRGVVGDIQSGGAHFIGRCGHLFDFAMLLLHAVAGLAGDGGRLVGGVAGLLQRPFDLSNDRLQLVEEAVEPGGEQAQFILAGVVQATGKVAFATGNVFQACRHGQDWPANAASGQPHQQQTHDCRAKAYQQAGEVGILVMGIKALVEGYGRGLQHAFRHFQPYLPRGCVRDWREGVGHAQQAVGYRICHGLAERAVVATVARQQAGGGGDTHLALAVEQVAAAVHTQLLQVGQADVQADHADYLAVFQQWQSDAGHQHLTAVDLVEVRFEHAGPGGVLRAGQPAVLRRAVAADAGVTEHRFRHGFKFQGAGAWLGPVQRETPALIAAQGVLPEVVAVLLVQGIGLEHQVQANHIRVAGQASTRLAGQFGAQVATTTVLQHLYQAGKAIAVLVGVHEVALDTQGLGFGVGLQALAGAVFEHGSVGLVDQGGAAMGLGQRGGYQQGDNGQQAQAGEECDLPLDGEATQRHEGFPFQTNATPAIRRGRCRQRGSFGNVVGRCRPEGFGQPAQVDQSERSPDAAKHQRMRVQVQPQRDDDAEADGRQNQVLKLVAQAFAIAFTQVAVVDDRQVDEAERDQGAEVDDGSGGNQVEEDRR